MSDFEHTSLHEELEVRVIALLTGELSEAEADELEKILAINEPLSAFRDQMAGLMGELHLASDELAPAADEAPRRLSEARRAKIFGDAAVLEHPTKATRKRLWFNPALWGVAASIAMVFMLGILGSIQFTQSILRKETVFEAAPASPAPQAEPEYTVNMEQRNRSTPPARAPAIVVKNPSALDVPSLDIDVNVDESAVYGRSGGGFGGGLEGLREMGADESRSADYAKAGETIPVEIPKERIEGTPQPIRVPGLEPRATEAPRMVVAGKSRPSDAQGEKQDAGGLSGVREMSLALTDFGYAGERVEKKQSNVDPFAAPPAPSEPAARAKPKRAVPVDGFARSGPVDPFAAPAASRAKPQSENAELEYASRRDAKSGPVDPFAAPVAGNLGMGQSEVADLRESRVKANYELRKQMLSQVEQAWERPKVFDLKSADDAAIDAGLSAKLNDIVIPQVNFSGVPMSQVVKTLNELSSAYDSEGTGVNIDYKPADGSDPKVNISLRNLNIDRILQFVTQQVNYSYDVGSDAITIQSASQLAGNASTRTEYFPINRETVIRLAGTHETDPSAEPIDPFAANAALVADKETKGLEKFFQKAGINFELPGSSLAFDGEQLIVTQTPRNLERLRRLLQHYEEVNQAAQETAQNVRLTPKPEKLAAEAPFSTFSLNISDVSFKLAQAALANSRVPPSAQIRTEEFVNSFDYGDPAPRPDQPVALHWEMAQHPFEHDRQVVRFSLQTQASGRASGQPLNLTLLVDNSGSMQRPDRQAILQNSLQTLEGKLTEQDQLNIVLFSRQPRLIAEAQTRVSQKAAVQSALDYRPEGGTNLEAGLKAAYESAQRNYLPTGSNRVILLTDGAANLGNVNAGELADYVVEQRKQGIALDAYGIGWDDYNDALLEAITRNGDGRYAFLNSVEDASTDFAEKLAGTLRVAAANVKVQIEWNPQRVQRYRQIGYDLHQLKKEDFRDNTVDAAEIGEAESGTALYVLKIDDDPEIIGGLGTLHVRYLDPADGRYKEHSWPLPMPRRVPAADAVSPSLRLAMSSAFFGERLAASPYASGYDFNDLYQMTNGLPEAFPNQPRVTELQSMLLRASELYGEK